jgi:hypothetical protein
MFIPQNSISLAAQEAFLLRNYPGFKKVHFIRGKKAVFEGYLQPMPLSKRYKVRISYEFRCRPVITLPEEDFTKERPPHTFDDGALCLYHRNGLGAWNSKKSINELLPMISHWLWCYELWKVTGKERWFGEEYPHDPAEKKEPN